MKKKTKKARRSLRRRVRRALATVRTVARRIRRRSTTAMSTRRRRRASGRSSTGLGAILPAGLLTTAGTTVAGFVGVAWLFNKLAEKFPSLANPQSPWMRIAGKAATAIIAGWALRRFASKNVGNGAAIGGLVAAGLDAYAQFQSGISGGLSGTDAPSLPAPATLPALAGKIDPVADQMIQRTRAAIARAHAIAGTPAA